MDGLHAVRLASQVQRSEVAQSAFSKSPKSIDSPSTTQITHFHTVLCLLGSVRKFASACCSSKSRTQRGPEVVALAFLAGLDICFWAPGANTRKHSAEHCVQAACGRRFQPAAPAVVGGLAIKPRLVQALVCMHHLSKQELRINCKAASLGSQRHPKA